MRCSWQSVGSFEGCEPDSTKWWGRDGGCAGVWAVLGGESGTIESSSMDGVAGVWARRKRRLRNVRRPEPSTFTRY